MKLFFYFLVFCSFNVMALNPGDKAPAFSLKNQEGESISLDMFKGKIVVLEWYNDGCPFVRKHYDSKNMQTIQKTYQDNDYVVWLTINSSAEGKQGHLATPKEAKAKMIEEEAAMKHMLLDHDGRVGQVYEAKTTPHMYLIDDKGIIRYAGAIDSISSANQGDIPKAKNYVLSGISKLLLQESPNPAKTKPYGCSVKY